MTSNYERLATEALGVYLDAQGLDRDKQGHLWYHAAALDPLVAKSVAPLVAERDRLREALVSTAENLDGLSEGSEGFCWCAGCTRAHRSMTCRGFAAIVAKSRAALAGEEASEWVDSGDCSPGDEDEAIRACLGKEFVLEQTIKEAREVRDALTQEIRRVR